VVLYPLNVKLVGMTEDKKTDMIIAIMSIFLELYIDVVFEVQKRRHS